MLLLEINTSNSYCCLVPGTAVFEIFQMHILRAHEYQLVLAREDFRTYIRDRIWYLIKHTKPGERQGVYIPEYVQNELSSLWNISLCELRDLGQAWGSNILDTNKIQFCSYVDSETIPLDSNT